MEGISPNLIKKLQDGHESAVLSRKLATIVIDVPVKIDWEKLSLGEIGNEKTIEALREFGFRSLVGRLSRGGDQNKDEKNVQMGLL